MFSEQKNTLLTSKQIGGGCRGKELSLNYYFKKLFLFNKNILKYNLMIFFFIIIDNVVKNMNLTSPNNCKER